MITSLRQALFVVLSSAAVAGCGTSDGPGHPRAPHVTLTPVETRTLTVTHQYPCHFRAGRHLRLKAPQAGYLRPMPISRGQAVNQDDVLFEIHSDLADLRPDTTAGTALAAIKAPFRGIVGQVPERGSFVRRGEVLTSLADDTVMGVYFNVPEVRYLEYKSAELDEHPEEFQIELLLTNSIKFDQPGKLVSIGNEFNSENGTVTFRADFPNPDRMLRHGMNGVVLVGQVQKDAVVIPQLATFEDDDKRYVYVVDSDDVAHRREVLVEAEAGDLFIIKSGVDVRDRIIGEGCRLVHDGDKVEHDGGKSRTSVAAVRAQAG